MQKKILIVDDDAALLETTAALLEEQGHAVITHASPFGVTNIVGREKPDLLLLDLDLPGLSGAALVKEALNRHAFNHSKLKILFHSGQSRSELTRLTKECGVAGFIEKSVSPEIMLATIAQHLHET